MWQLVLSGGKKKLISYHTCGIVQGILATGYNAPTEIQAEAIPIAIAGKSKRSPEFIESRDFVVNSIKNMND